MIIASWRLQRWMPGGSPFEKGALLKVWDNHCPLPSTKQTKQTYPSRQVLGWDFYISFFFFFFAPPQRGYLHMYLCAWVGWSLNMSICPCPQPKPHKIPATTPATAQPHNQPIPPIPTTPLLLIGALPASQKINNHPEETKCTRFQPSIRHGRRNFLWRISFRENHGPGQNIFMARRILGPQSSWNHKCKNQNKVKMILPFGPGKTKTINRCLDCWIWAMAFLRELAPQKGGFFCTGRND